MRLSQLFTKTSKTVPADETAKNAKLLIQAGYIHKEMAGVYAYLPLGLKVLENIKQIVREEMDALGGQEIIMTSLQRQELWAHTDRWDDEKVDVWFKSELKNGTPVGFGWSHEEPITDMMKNYISSYRDLPANVYQFQTKLRNELRAKSGIMRGREFVMKDLYSYSRSDQEHQKFYDAVTAAYLKVFERVGLGDVTFVTFASGGAFTQFSHEFQTITEAGEDTIFLSRDKKIAVNKEVLSDNVLKQLGLERGELEEVTAAEVGNIFSFGGAKSEQLGLYFTDEDGHDKPVILGSYGIGVTRLMGVIAEHFADDKGLVWPAAVAPAQVYLARLGASPQTVAAADELYNQLTAKNIGVLYDDRDVRPGEKFADADLLGIPTRVVVSDKTVDANNYEVKGRSEAEATLVDQQQLFKILGLED
ncbi:MAG TPA: aminoacyl--tRNA ligase-related protein [Candidatus Saccharimonadales bacterium]|nr:aminoacyl--tRNA ligase-related protein [Candidatus Saccharimonadales bacterium]